MYVLLGLGIQGKAILHYLLTYTQERIVSFDPAFAKSDFNIFEGKESKWTHFQRKYHPDDAFNLKQKIYPEQLKDQYVAISSLPTEVNRTIITHLLLQGFSWIDLGGDTSTAKYIANVATKINPKDSKIKPTVVPDCGIAPGLVSSIARWGQKKSYSEIYLFCGGLPVNPTPPLSYVQAFSPQGVIKEYSGICDVITKGKHEKEPALANPEYLFIPGLGVLEARNTSGSLSTTPEELFCDNNLRELKYKTLRYPGHWNFVRKWIMGYPDSIERMTKMTPKLDSNNPDLIVLHVEFANPTHWISPPETFKFTWRWDYNYDLDIGAMAEITGYTAAATATMIHDGLLPVGYVPMHDVPFEELKKRISFCPNQFREVKCL